MPRQYLSTRVANLKPSGIRKFFDIAATMKDVISLGIGEPDFTTPKPILDSGIQSLARGETHYTSNSGLIELRKALSSHLEKLYGADHGFELRNGPDTGATAVLDIPARRDSKDQEG